ncbi:MAG TPA: HD domain-containing phosphohydrolase [Polyangiaceae bacterium]|jgi:response regulator RpfG family c-di-GMP phosphodiesterase
MSNPRILCVDDEPRVLEGLQRTLFKQYAVSVSVGGEAALARLDAGETYEVVISDMRMPGMNGAVLLSKFRQRAPDTVRVLLTGHSELEPAIAAVNEGNIFRFLTKPCPPETLSAALQAATAQYRLVTAERVLLEQTLVGSMRAFTEVLALTHAEAFGPNLKQHERARLVAERMGIPDAWHVEIASMLSSIGYVVLPGDVLSKLSHGKALASSEAHMLAQVPKIAESVVSKIPRLDKVRAVLEHQASWLGKTLAAAGSARELPLGARILRVLYDLGVAENETGDTRQAIGVLRSRSELYDPAVLDALSDVCAVKPPEVRPLPLAEVRAGMVFAADVTLDSGMLLVARGQRVTEQVLLRLTNHYARRVKEPLLCEIPSS